MLVRKDNVHVNFNIRSEFVLLAILLVDVPRGVFISHLMVWPSQIKNIVVVLLYGQLYGYFTYAVHTSCKR